MDYSTPGLPVHHQLPEFTQIHVHWVSDAIQPSYPCRPLLLLPSIFLSIRIFSKESLFSSGGQSIGASPSASVLPVNIQGWFPLGLTGLISVQSKGLSRVISNITIQKHQFFAWGGQNIGVSASTSVLPMNTQDWFPVGWIGWISVQSKGLSRVFSKTTIPKHQFFSAQLSL